jgi:hypothetical protein
MLSTIYLMAAVVGGTVLVCQFVLTLMGMGDDGVDMGDASFDGDVPGDAVHAGHDHATTLSEAAAGSAALAAGFSQPMSLIVATAVGLGAMYGMYGLMRLIAGLKSSGNERIRNALGRPATIYIPIPAARKGAGKVQLSTVTEDDEPLKTGQSVQIVGIVGSDVVKVRRAPQAVEA